LPDTAKFLFSFFSFLLIHLVTDFYMKTTPYTINYN